MSNPLKRTRLMIIIAVFLILTATIGALVWTLTINQNHEKAKDPSLYTDVITLEVVTKEQSYPSGSQVPLSIYLVNGRNETLALPQ